MPFPPIERIALSPSSMMITSSTYSTSLVRFGAMPNWICDGVIFLIFTGVRIVGLGTALGPISPAGGPPFIAVGSGVHGAGFCCADGDWGVVGFAVDDLGDDAGAGGVAASFLQPSTIPSDTISAIATHHRR